MRRLSKIKDLRKIKKYFCVSIFLVPLIFLFSCGQIQSPKPKPYIGENSPPTKQEFRWSNGKLPKSFDPARASAAPETDIVRAIYEGLTDIDSKTLKPIPALATKWTSSSDFKTWTFQLRKDAKWTNGEPIIAQDFIDSWKRLAELGSKVTQRSLLKNIVGLDSENVLPIFAQEPNEELEKVESNKVLKENQNTDSNLTNSNNANSTTQNSSNSGKNIKKETVKPKAKLITKLGIQAINDYSIKITLIYPDEDFPSLVSHPIFRPIYGDGDEFETEGLTTDVVTNGAFKITSVGKDGITLERSPIYWNKNTVLLENVKFVPSENAESALADYRDGKVDAVTNANFQPLALKLLEPYKDEFQQTTHGALNYYQFNLEQKPFDDSRVRKALAISIEREHLTEGEMDGATVPALSFLPFEDDQNRLEQNVEKGKKLLAQAGFPNGENFPTIKLVINRNNVQQKIANSISKMWLKNLNIKTDIIVKDQTDVENSVQTRDFSLVRHGVVLPTNNETTNMLTLFNEPEVMNLNPEEKEFQREGNGNRSVLPNQILNGKTAESNLNLNANENKTSNIENNSEQKIIIVPKQLILTESQALEQLPAIPLYFPTSYSLVKPYVKGFDLNAFDATSLKNVEIDSNWQPTDNNSNSNKQ